MGLMSPITGRIFDKIGARILSITGLTAIFVTTLLLTHLTKTTPFAYLSIVYAIRMVGMGMVLMPVTTAGLNQAPAPFDSSRNGHEQYNETDVRIDRDGCSHHHHDTACAS